MTWNLWWRFGPWEERAAAVERVVADEAPDVVCLQEVWSDGDTSSAGRLAEALGLHHVLSDDPFADLRSGRPGFHNAILSREPIEVVASRPLPRADGSDGHRRALVARTTHGDRSWTVVSTHLDHRFDESAVRQLQCEALLALVAEVRDDPDTSAPVVIGGDFNAVPDSDEIRLLTGRRAGPVRNLVLSDCWEFAGDGPGCTWRDDNPYQSVTAWPNRRLDYVFVSWPRPKPLGNPVRAWLAGVEPVDGVVASDHAAVVVDLVGA
jgi:endonuclease/exonuclease/phosphatase family metal-dependent hydrolase